jgi:hypothetical protein
LQVKGLLRVELSPVLDELPFLAGCSVTLLSRPELDFDIRQAGAAHHRAASGTAQHSTAQRESKHRTVAELDKLQLVVQRLQMVASMAGSAAG